MVMRLHFNCTIQELKLDRINDHNPDNVDFNCTIQELKLTINLIVFYVMRDFNCTIQELKPRISENTDIEVYISIAPYRN